jgi:hypothetical protein
MFLNHWKFVLASSLFLVSVHAFAADPHALAVNPTDQQAYCTYIMEQAQAERDLLRTPTAMAGMTQPETGLPMQLVGGHPICVYQPGKRSSAQKARSDRTGLEVAGCANGKDVKDGGGSECNPTYALLAADDEDQAGR